MRGRETFLVWLEAPGHMNHLAWPFHGPPVYLLSGITGDPSVGPEVLLGEVDYYYY